MTQHSQFKDPLVTAAEIAVSLGWVSTWLDVLLSNLLLTFKGAFPF